MFVLVLNLLMRRVPKEIYPVPSSGMGTLQPNNTIRRLRRRVALGYHAPPQSDPGILIYLSAWLWGAAGITTTHRLLIKLISHACSFMRHLYCSTSTVLREGGH